ncbi:MAG: bifunctional [glutamine synthetase] adenylyltransferase/[glutamine synthetase]-adenylyl-L-tyrosine phosphorylase, partial [Actinomycetota bacterium]|nr:bifunctional [glutamine synthetase] adenylyltransferase/[glutamine synthetase]-adenylyl-L-tyrosine phosphorylase [Actinomycetota bacterium]
MTDGRRSGLSLARLGLTDDGAAETLTRLGWWSHGRVCQDAGNSLWALSRAPDPNLALRTLGRLARAAGPEWDELDAALRREPGLRGRLLGLLGSSTALGDHLVAHPPRWHILVSDGALSPGWAEHAQQRLLAAVGVDPADPGPVSRTGVEAQRALRDTYRDLIAELAAAD